MQILLLEILFEVAKAGNVFFHSFPLGISHENHAIDASQDKLPGRIVDDLSRYGVELEFRFESLKRKGTQWQKIKKKCSICCRGERDKVASVRRSNSRMYIREVGCLATQRRPVVDDFELNLFVWRN